MAWKGFGRPAFNEVDPATRRFLDRLARAVELWATSSGSVTIGSSGLLEVVIDPNGLLVSTADGLSVNGIGTTAQGDLLYVSASNTLTVLNKSATATRYLSNTGTNNNPAWAQVDLTNGVSGTLPVANGGTGSGTAFNNNRILVSAAGAVAEAAALTNGQLLIGSTGAAPVAAGLTGTSNQITVTTGAGSITLSLPQNIHTAATPQFAGMTLQAAAAIDGSAPVTMLIRSTTSSGSWTTGADVCNLDFRSDDGSGAGAGVRSRISMKTAGAGGGTYGLHFFVDTGSGLTEVFRYDKDTRFQVALSSETGIGKFNVFTSATSQQAFYAVMTSGWTAELIRIRDTSGNELFQVDAASNVVMPVAGSGLKIKEGTNCKMGTATLVAGTVTVNTTQVTANSRIFLTVQSLGTVTTPKAVAVTARTAGTSFTITSADGTDTSVVAWMIVEPA